MASLHRTKDTVFKSTSENSALETFWLKSDHLIAAQSHARVVRIFVEKQDEQFVILGPEATKVNQAEVLAKTEYNFGQSMINPILQVDVVRLKKSPLTRLLSHLVLNEKAKVELWKFAAETDPAEFVLQCEATPGNLSRLEAYLSAEELSAAISDHPTASLPVVAIFAGGGGGRGRGQLPRPEIGVCSVWPANRTMALCSFTDNGDLDTLDSVLLQLAPKECLIDDCGGGGGGQGGHAKPPSASKLERLLQTRAILTTSVSAKLGPTTQPRSVLKKMESLVDLTAHDASLLVKDEHHSLLAASLLLPLVEQQQRDLGGDHPLRLKTFSTTHFMPMSTSTMEGLHIEAGGGGQSLWKTVLNRTRSAGGERLLKQWIRQPLKREQDIQHRLDLVDNLVANNGLRKVLHEECLRKMPDFEKLSLKMIQKKAKLQDLYKSYTGIGESGKVLDLLREHFGAGVQPFYSHFQEPLEKCIDQLEKFVQLVEKTIDFEAIGEGRYQVQASFDEHLSVLQKRLEKNKLAVKKLLPQEAAQLGLDSGQKTSQLKLESNAQFGFYFRVTMKDERSLRQRKDLIFLDSAKSGIKFRTSRLAEANGHFLETIKSYELQQEHVVRQVLDIAFGYGQPLQDLGSLVSQLDCITSLATAAVLAPIPYVKPQLNKAGVIRFKKIRHPCLEQMDNVNYIPNDADFGQDENRFFVITGPNLGGKSTYMRSVALCVYLAQIGSFVPCELANVCPVDNILVRVGASDSQQDGVSTFMAEMLDASRILRNATKNSLILIDELGRGTSTYDGFGLAWAISHFIASEVKAFAMFATHFHEMTQLAGHVGPNVVQNIHCDALVEDGAFTLLYTIKAGSCDKSYGIEVAKLAGFPDQIVHSANNYLEKAEKENMFTLDEETLQKLVDLINEFKQPMSMRRKNEEQIAHEATALLAKRAKR